MSVELKVSSDIIGKLSLIADTTETSDKPIVR